MAEPIPPPSPQQIVVLRSLLIPVMRVSGLVVALGIIFCVDAFTRALFGTLNGSLGWIPYLNRVVASPLHRLEQKITNFLGGLETHIDVSMGGFFHNLAIVVDGLANGTIESGWITLLLGKAIHRLHGITSALPSITHVTRITKVIQHETTIIRRTVVHADKVATHAAPAIVTRQVGALAGELEHVIEWDLPRLRARERAAESELGRLWKRVKTRPLALGAAAATALVTAVLARLGVTWIRCRNWKRIGRTVCNTGAGDIEALLGLFAAGATIASFRELVQLGQQVEHGVATVLQDVAKL